MPKHGRVIVDGHRAVRTHLALAIIGALKSCFGEPMTISDICRRVPRSYQPVHETVRRLAKLETISLRREGRRVLCEPAATASGSLWLAQWSVYEAQELAQGLLGELVRILQSQIDDSGFPPEAILALDPIGPENIEVYLTHVGFRIGSAVSRVNIVSCEKLGEAMRGPDGSWAVARRIIPLAGHQALWRLALKTRERSALEVRLSSQPSRVPSAFID